MIARVCVSLCLLLLVTCWKVALSLSVCQSVCLDLSIRPSVQPTICSPVRLWRCLNRQTDSRPVSVCVSDLKDSRFLDLILTNLTWFRCLCLCSQKTFCVDEAWVKMHGGLILRVDVCVFVCVYACLSVCFCVCMCVCACVRVYHHRISLNIFTKYWLVTHHLFPC